MLALLANDDIGDEWGSMLRSAVVRNYTHTN